MKKLLLLCACLLALATPLRAATSAPPQVAVVRIYEGMGTIVAIITRGEGKSERIEFDRGNSDKHLLASSEGYYKVFQRLYQEGYVLQSTLGATTGPATEYVTLLFVKAG